MRTLAESLTPPPLPPLNPPPPTPTRPVPAGEPSADFLDLIPHEFARRHLILSAGVSDAMESLRVSPATSAAAIVNVGSRLRRAVVTVTADPETIAADIDRAYSARRSTSPPGPDDEALQIDRPTDLDDELADALRDAERDLLSTHGKAPAVRLVDLLLFEAALRNASDVHVQPLHDRTLVRYRLDGALFSVRELPAALAASVVSRIKVMARMDVAEQRAPQDGRATVTIGGAASAGERTANRRAIDLRVSTLPSTRGERVVLRLLDPARSPHLRSFAGLGMPPAVESRYLAQAARASGILLSTGPTGSGKTTTLYATLAWISADHAGNQERGCELNMMTIEDPVEYDLTGSGLAVSQTQVDPKKNVTFAAGLRHILRQDPDVIMVGEIRDPETARTAVQASLTGHLVLSTLHTNDAAGAVARLLDLGVEPYLVASSLNAVLAQRLVRTIHPACAGAGCPECLHTGFRGRVGVFELLVLDDRPPASKDAGDNRTASLRDLVAGRADDGAYRPCSAAEFRAAAQVAGMVTLRQAGAELVRRGVTTAAEVARVIDALDEDEVLA